MNPVAVRVDASKRIGLGHLKRCLALAQALKAIGTETIFLCRNSDIDLGALTAGFEMRTLPGPAQAAAGHDHRQWLPVPPEQDAEDALQALRDRRPRAVVVDHYALDARWHRIVRSATAVPLAAVDDLADRPLDIDLLVDHNPDADHARKYAAVLERPAQLCTGPRFALLDPVYTATRPRRWSDTVHSIGIFMGGTDPGGHSSLAWQACREHARWHGPITIATTSSNAALPGLQALCERDPLLSLCIDQPHLAGFHAAHDLQIGAGGGALWERCVLGVPTLALVTARNQLQSVPMLARDGIVSPFCALEPGADMLPALGAAIARLVDDHALRADLRQRSMNLVDGHGAGRVAHALLHL